MIVVGIDAAVSAGNVGMAVARWRSNRPDLLEVCCGKGSRPMAAWSVERLMPWLATGEPMLVAIDAPLGWPRGLQTLAAQPAGSGRDATQASEDPFTRHTDRVVRAVTGKVPLAVGADRIARTAAASLELLHALRVASGRRLPLVWSPEGVGDGGCIEVYPAATRIARRALVAACGDAREGATARVLDVLAGEFAFADGVAEAMRGSEHARDAGLAALAGLDFLRGDAMPPRAEELAAAEAEGWIWFYRPRYCRRCSEPLLANWRGVPRGLAAVTKPALPDLPRIAGTACPHCGGLATLGVEDLAFRPLGEARPGRRAVECSIACGAAAEPWRAWMRAQGIAPPMAPASVRGAN